MQRWLSITPTAKPTFIPNRYRARKLTTPTERWIHSAKSLTAWALTILPSNTKTVSLLPVTRITYGTVSSYTISLPMKPLFIPRTACWELKATYFPTLRSLPKGTELKFPPTMPKKNKGTFLMTLTQPPSVRNLLKAVS